MSFDSMAPIADKLLRSDGSVTSLDGSVIHKQANEAGAAQWARSAPIVDKLLREDGSVAPLTDFMGGGGSGLTMSQVKAAIADATADFLTEIPNATATTTGGFRARLEDGKLYITIDGTNP